MSLLASLGTPCVSAELGAGVEEKVPCGGKGYGCLFSAICVDHCSTRASTGFYWFPLCLCKYGSARKNGSHLGNISVAAFFRGCHPFQPTA